MINSEKPKQRFWVDDLLARKNHAKAEATSLLRARPCYRSSTTP
jgi:hypothetical protein